MIVDSSEVVHLYHLVFCPRRNIKPVQPALSYTWPVEGELLQPWVEEGESIGVLEGAKKILQNFRELCPEVGCCLGLFCKAVPVPHKPRTRR